MKLSGMEETSLDSIKIWDISVEKMEDCEERSNFFIIVPGTTPKYYFARVGIVDLEFKMYTKLEEYSR